MDRQALFANRKLRWLLAALAGLAILYGAINWPRWQVRAQIAAGFGARIACSCRYVEGRDLGSCKADFKGLKGMAMVNIADDPETRTISASVPILARRKASYKTGFGCLPDKVD